MEPLDFSWDNLRRTPAAGSRRKGITASQICPEALSLIIRQRILVANDFKDEFDVPPAVSTWAAYLFVLLHLCSANGTDTYIVGKEAFVTSLITKGLNIEQHEIDRTTPEISQVDRAIMTMTDRQKTSIATMAETLGGLSARRYAVLAKVLRASGLIEFIDVTEDFGGGAIGCRPKLSGLPNEALEIGA